jgi:hypothetical protein
MPQVEISWLAGRRLMDMYFVNWKARYEFGPYYNTITAAVAI